MDCIWGKQSDFRSKFNFNLLKVLLNCSDVNSFDKGQIMETEAIIKMGSLLYRNLKASISFDHFKKIYISLKILKIYILPIALCAFLHVVLSVIYGRIYKSQIFNFVLDLICDSK